SAVDLIDVDEASLDLAFSCLMKRTKVDEASSDLAFSSSSSDEPETDDKIPDVDDEDK
ncbi:MAG: hypothetical protein Q9174_003764, partial [Haloplaca sp. 1 TL-2023]